MKSIELSGLICPVVSHPTRGAWIEIGGSDGGSTDAQGSHPTRGAWIEIFSFLDTGAGGPAVAPHTGCVD